MARSCYYLGCGECGAISRIMGHLPNSHLKEVRLSLIATKLLFLSFLSPIKADLFSSMALLGGSFIFSH